MNESHSKNDKLDFGINRSRMLNLLNLRSQSQVGIDVYQKLGLSSAERLFIDFIKNNSLTTSMHMENRRIAVRGEPVTQAFILMDGEAIASDGNRRYRIGPGAVLGLAECIANEPHRLSVLARTTVTTGNLPVDRVLRELVNMNKGLRGISRTTVMRILQTRQIPESLK